MGFMSRRVAVLSAVVLAGFAAFASAPAQLFNPSDADNAPATITDPQTFNRDFPPSVSFEQRRRRHH